METKEQLRQAVLKWKRAVENAKRDGGVGKKDVSRSEKLEGDSGKYFSNQGKDPISGS